MSTHTRTRTHSLPTLKYIIRHLKADHKTELPLISNCRDEVLREGAGWFYHRLNTSFRIIIITTQRINTSRMAGYLAHRATLIHSQHMDWEIEKGLCPDGTRCTVMQCGSVGRTRGGKLLRAGIIRAQSDFPAGSGRLFWGCARDTV